MYATENIKRSDSSLMQACSAGLEEIVKQFIEN
jgi:hypothetical protein